MTNTYVLEPIDPASADALRTTGGRRYVADAKPGFPCRQCLRDAEVGEAMILVNHDPFDAAAASAYRSASPIFLHAEPCSLPPDDEALPDYLTVRQLSVRGFDSDAMMVEADVIDGIDLAAALDRFFAGDGIDYVHIHNAKRGCWAATVRRMD